MTQECPLSLNSIEWRYASPWKFSVTKEASIAGDVDSLSVNGRFQETQRG